MSRLIALALTSALLSGCATQTPVADKGVEQEAASKAEQAATVPEKPFPADSLYDLLVAEFALRRQAYDVTLDMYLKQAPVLRDPGISAHTTHLAQFLQRPEAALQSAQLWVELEPDNAEANSTMASLLAQQGRPLDALPYLVMVEQQAGTANFPMLFSGYPQLNEQQRMELVQDIDKLAAQYPQNTQLMLTQALFHTENKQYDQALEELRAVLELEPEQPQALLLEARILMEQKAKNPFARLQRALEEQPDDSRLRLQYARMLATTDMAAAREQFEILSAQAPQDSDLIFSLALINREMGDSAAARKYLQQTIALGQRRNEAYYYLGRIAEDDSNPEEAVTAYMQVGIGPEYLAANTRIGLILAGQGELERSHAWFEQQRENIPPLREQLYGLEVDILTRANATQEAEQVLDQALKETPGSVSLRYARAMLREQQDDLVAMEKDLRAILATDPNNTTALNALGYTLADRTTRYAEAQALVARALELQPGEPAIMDSMGWVLFRTGQYDEAVAYLTRAYAQFPDPEVAAHLGEVLWVKGDQEGAIAVWRAALARDAQHPVLLETLHRLGVELPPALPLEVSPAMPLEAPPAMPLEVPPAQPQS
ncbi:MAG: tetratricopeptide repeat protein [Haliea sp.]|nr:tetratricopeptide repeat protein [Haliea sp.]